MRTALRVLARDSCLTKRICCLMPSTSSSSSSTCCSWPPLRPYWSEPFWYESLPYEGGAARPPESSWERRASLPLPRMPPWTGALLASVLYALRCFSAG